MTKDIGVVVGRFQVPSLHDGHQQLLDLVSSRHDKILIVVGCAMWTGTPENPLDFPARMTMLKTRYPNAVVLPISDTMSDLIWSQKLDNLIREAFPFGGVQLYGGRDSFINHYHGKFDTMELDGITDAVSGTRVREEVARRILQTEEERRGAIYNAQNQYKKVYPCADMVVWIPSPGANNLPTKQCKVLLGRKKGDTGWRTPGGHVDYEDETYEQTAIREAREETGAHIEHATYIGSFRLVDYCTTPTQIKHTALFLGRHLWGPLEASDDLDEIKQFTFEEALNLPYTPEHQAMMEATFEFLGFRD